jgi:hypothetical protein
VAGQHLALTARVSIRQRARPVVSVAARCLPGACQVLCQVLLFPRQKPRDEGKA